MQDKQKTIAGLQDRVTMLTRTIGDRSIRRPHKLAEAADYIQGWFEGLDLPVRRQFYSYKGMKVSNVVARLGSTPHPARHYVLGAHYDTVAGTVGADDNASAVAVLMETAQAVRAEVDLDGTDVAVTAAAFALEEPPAFGKRFMGSRVFAAEAKRNAVRIDGMICLEMVGYTCHRPGCQHYPLPLRFMGYPRAGDFIGIVGNLKSKAFARGLRRSFENNPNLPVVALTVPLNGWLMPAVRLSDHSSFWNFGYRAVMVTDTAFYRNPHYHLPSDTMQTLDFGFMAELVQSLTTYFGSRNNTD